MKTILLLGPTASGKSAVAMALAERFAIEIVSVDSAQVYRGLDIGTAKPCAEERARVPHHLIDIVDPEDSYSAARFADDARRLIDEIRARGRLPLLVGGTMLYAKALREGLHDLPPADPDVRADLDRRAAAQGWPALHRWLAEVDPAIFTKVLIARPFPPQVASTYSARVAGDEGITVLDGLECWLYQHGLRHMGEIELARGLVGLGGMTS